MRIFTALLILATSSCALAGHGDVLVSSSFHFGQDGWSLFGPGDLAIGDRSGMLFGSDKGKTVWYFSAPSSFLGDKCFAYNGILSFRLGHSEYMSNGKDMIQDWDVILESKVWDLRIGQRNVVPAWVGASNHELSLNERAGWVNMRSGHAPTTTEMLRLFTSLSGILIRGGYYDGHEESWLDNVVLKEGDHKADALLRQVEKHARHPSERVAEVPAPAPEEPSVPKYTGVLRSKAAIAAHLAREAAFQAAKQAHEEEQARLAEAEREAVLRQEAAAAAELAAQQEAAKRAAEEKATRKKTSPANDGDLGSREDSVPNEKDTVAAKVQEAPGAKAKGEPTAKASSTDPKAKVKPDAKASAEHQAKKSDSKAAAQGQGKVKPDARAAAEAQAKEKPDARAAAEAQAKEKPDAKASAEAQAKEKPDAKAAAEANSNVESPQHVKHQEEIAAARLEYNRARTAESAAAANVQDQQRGASTDKISLPAAASQSPTSETASGAAPEAAGL